MSLSFYSYGVFVLLISWNTEIFMDALFSTKDYLHTDVTSFAWRNNGNIVFDDLRGSYMDLLQKQVCSISN